MLDFAALPPEVNSGLMYTGPGSGPMLAAAAAWDGLGSELYLTASAYGSVISDLAAVWLGPSSIAMAAAAAPYVSWISATAGLAEATGMQAKAAVAAYEAAFAMTVPPPVIAANRALLMALIATNFFGQNTPAIMATEAQYMEMWAQDAAAMYGYRPRRRRRRRSHRSRLRRRPPSRQGWARNRRSPKPQTLPAQQLRRSR